MSRAIPAQAPSIRLDVFRDPDLSPAGAVGADLVEACAPFAAAHPEIAALAARCPAGFAVTVRCASATIFDEWPTVSPDALGFFATVTSPDPEGPGFRALGIGASLPSLPASGRRRGSIHRPSPDVLRLVAF